MSAKESVFTSHCVHVTLPSVTTEFGIQPFGDIHFGSPGHDPDRFNDFLETCKERQARMPMFYIGMGDEQEACSHSERRVFQNPDLHDSQSDMLDEVAHARNVRLLDKIGFMRNHLLGMLQGNHFWEFRANNEEKMYTQGMTSDEWLAKQLDTRWLGWVSYLRMSISFENTTKTSTIDIVACHGKAGGKLAGSSINQVDDLRRIFPTADVYLMAHDHQCGAWPVTQLLPGIESRAQPGNLVMKELKQYLARSGSFLRAYVPGAASYAVKALYRPSVLGTVFFSGRFRKRCSDDQEALVLDLKAEA